MRKLALTILVLLLVGTSPVSSAGVLEDAEEYVRRNPNDPKGHLKLGKMYLSTAFPRTKKNSLSEIVN